MPKGNPGGYKKFGDKASGLKKAAEKVPAAASKGMAKAMEMTGKAKGGSLKQMKSHGKRR